MGNVEDTVESPVLTYREAARTARVSERTMRKLIRDGKLSAVRIGKCVRIPREALLRLLSGN
jgi:excisionase family DNA binding protein